VSGPAAAAKPFRLLPRTTALTEPFWTGGSRGELVLQRCQACGYYLHPPTPVCPRDLSRDIAPEPVSGRGHVLSATVNQQSWNPTMPAPYVVALVALVEQPEVRLMTNIVGLPPDDVWIGMAVRVVFEQHDDIWVPLFEPDPEGPGA